MKLVKLNSRLGVMYVNPDKIIFVEYSCSDNCTIIHLDGTNDLTGANMIFMDESLDEVVSLLKG